MKLLVVTPPQFGHVRPPLPLVRALAAAQHRVAWATGADALSRLADEPVEPMCCGLTAQAARDQLRARWPDLASLPAREHGPATRQGLFAEVLAPAMAVALARCIETWQPDAVLHDPLALAVGPACEARGLPRVEHAFGWPLPPLPNPGSPSWPVGSGLPPDLRIEIVPKGLRGPAPSTGDEIGCRPFARHARDASALPDRVRALLAHGDGCPVVLASFGTVFHTRDALRVVAETLARMPVRSIVLGTDRAALGVQASPRQVLLPWLDQSVVLPFCDAVVSHGGAGTVLGALAHGCPLVVLPQGADHFRNAEAVCRAGAGCVLEAPVDRAALEKAIRAVLEGRAPAGAEAAASAIEAMPSPEVAAARLVAALTHRVANRGRRW